MSNTSTHGYGYDFPETPPNPTTGRIAVAPVHHEPPPPATVQQLSRFGPRWNIRDVCQQIAQYTLEMGIVEGTTDEWQRTQDPEADFTFHCALDIMAASLFRAKQLVLRHRRGFSEAESVLIGKEIKNVDWGMTHLLYSFVAIRHLETPTMAWNVGTGIERHFFLFKTFQAALEGKLVGEGKEEADKYFAKTNKYFEEVIILFKGPPGSKRPEEDPTLGTFAEINEPLPAGSAAAQPAEPEKVAS
ncbi:hypothetical protein COCVIDRAFT_111642 [Bipolaris victoriae FI3]|uniref:Uncharacterized protein n=1 Tax=Bipolaris victoriae (strain FI3) TaxID=930091 RepID=W7E5D4_BIPV3|nr:hypothetical protein COCVIDRAFT_111642 [Bipolaris victoriae FI3]